MVLPLLAAGKLLLRHVAKFFFKLNNRNSILALKQYKHYSRSYMAALKLALKPYFDAKRRKNVSNI